MKRYSIDVRNKEEVKTHLKKYIESNNYGILIGRKIKKVCRDNKVKFIINDDPWLAKKLDAPLEISPLVVDIFKEHSFRAVSPLKYCDDLSLDNSDVLKKYKKEDVIDIKKSSKLLDALSEFDNAQSVVCAEGYIIAIEAVEGTDALLKRSWQVRKDLDQLKTKSGFLVKKIKKSQSRFIDLPVVGPRTISLIKKANLKGLAIDIKNTLIYKKNDFLRLAKEYDLIIYDIN